MQEKINEYLNRLERLGNSNEFLSERRAVDTRAKNAFTKLLRSDEEVNGETLRVEAIKDLIETISFALQDMAKSYASGLNTLIDAKMQGMTQIRIRDVNHQLKLLYKWLKEIVNEFDKDKKFKIHAVKICEAVTHAFAFEKGPTMIKDASYRGKISDVLSVGYTFKNRAEPARVHVYYYRK